VVLVKSSKGVAFTLHESLQNRQPGEGVEYYTTGSRKRWGGSNDRKGTKKRKARTRRVLGGGRGNKTITTKGVPTRTLSADLAFFTKSTALGGVEQGDKKTVLLPKNDEKKSRGKKPWTGGKQGLGWKPL